MPKKGSNTVANKIAAFSSGVAPVKAGMDTSTEDEILVEEVLHKLEAASRMPAPSGKCQLSKAVVQGAYKELQKSRETAARLEKELEELKNSRVQLLPPSAWIKREQKYKMDLERYEHTIGMQQQRLEKLEDEVKVLQAGANIKPLEEKIMELEEQLKSASQERTNFQSKFHELSIKHRQLIETSPQVASIWNEVVVQSGGDAPGDLQPNEQL